jgi:DNA polymerase-3 subunit chi
VRVDFYQLSRDPAEAVLPLIARNTLAAGERLLVVSNDAAQLDRIGGTLWSRIADSFLANGRAGGQDDARQPILLSAEPVPANGARFCAFADGVWREGETPFSRSFLLFGDDTLLAARECWRELGRREELERHFWKQDEDGRWREASSRG